MIIGLSVSGCIYEMVSGKIDPATVEKIIGRTACRTPEVWDEVLAGYVKYEWREFPEKADRLAREFLTANKIEQPRLDPINPRMPLCRKRIWVKSGRRIRYMPM